MTVTITIEVEVEVDLYYEPASRGQRGECGQPIDPDVSEHLEIESFKVIVPKELTSEQEADALKAGWEEIESARNQEP